MLKGLELEFAHQFFWVAVQNVEIRGECCVCIKQRAVGEQRGEGCPRARAESLFASFLPVVLI